MLGVKGMLTPKLLSLKISNEKLELREELGLVRNREEGKKSKWRVSNSEIPEQDWRRRNDRVSERSVPFLTEILAQQVWEEEIYW